MANPFNYTTTCSDALVKATKEFHAEHPNATASDLAIFINTFLSAYEKGFNQAKFVYN
jgi:hypothetical protein